MAFHEQQKNFSPRNYFPFFCQIIMRETYTIFIVDYFKIIIIIINNRYNNIDDQYYLILVDPEEGEDPPKRCLKNSKNKTFQ